MKRILLEDTKIGESLAVGFEQAEDGEVGFSIGCYDVMSVYGMELETWKRFVQAVNQANIIQKLEELD